MALPIEREPVTSKIGGEQEISPLNIERKEVVTPVPTQFKAQVNDDAGKPLITNTAQAVTIELPKPVEELRAESRGDTDNALTWWASLWLRLFKKYVFRNSTGN